MGDFPGHPFRGNQYTALASLHEQVTKGLKVVPTNNPPGTDPQHVIHTGVHTVTLQTLRREGLIKTSGIWLGGRTNPDLEITPEGIARLNEKAAKAEAPGVTVSRGDYKASRERALKNLGPDLGSEQKVDAKREARLREAAVKEQDRRNALLSRGDYKARREERKREMGRGRKDILGGRKLADMTREEVIQAVNKAYPLSGGGESRHTHQRGQKTMDLMLRMWSRSVRKG